MDDLALRDGSTVVTADGSFAFRERGCDIAGLVVTGVPVGVAATRCETARELSSGEPTSREGIGPLVVASALWAAPSSAGAESGAPHALASAPALAGELRAEGHHVVCRPVERGEVSPEVAALVESLHEDAHPLALVLVPEGASVADGGVRMLEAAEIVLGRWARASLARRVLLSAPRSFCAGVERAIEIVERALGRFGSPVYVRRQIVHNTHVVGRLASMGAVFVDELDEVPDGAVVVLAAHGVSPAVRHEAGCRESLTVIDATCPLVAKVHREARRFASRGFTIALVGHPDHEEVEGTLGEAPEQIHVVSTPSDVAAFEPDPGSRIAYLTQTTLATDETKSVVDALRRRFGDVTGPSSEDICYATQNRQDALRAMTSECDLVLVVGSANSSNTARLVEVARREGVRAELVEDAGQLRLSWLDGARTIGLTAGASAPEPLVVDVVEALSRLGPVEVDERRTTTETVRFPLPLKVR